MTERSQVISAEELEAMTAAERADLFSEALVTEADSLDEHTAAVVARGSAKMQARLQAQG